ncbi:MAG TPA: class I SAM-dependent methyltransferase [Thermoanaerobaculia bacterium]|nr:class I SAM-dependent methyltransferase [Thermoanaerobaculia bacterium]
MAFREDLYPDEYFEQLHRVTPFAATERKWRERDRDILALADPGPHKTVLDLGSALGDVCFLLAPHVKEAVGVDASPRAIELARARASERGFENVRFVAGDVADLGAIPGGSVDVAGAFDLLEHVDDDTVRRMLRSLARVLKPGGVFVAYTPNREHYVERLKARNVVLKQFPEHIAVRDPREIRKILESEGWRLRSLTYSPAPFPVVRWIERALLPVPLLGRFFRYRILLRAAPVARGEG